MKHFLSIEDLERDDVTRLFRLTAELKSRIKTGDRATPLTGRSMALIFEKPSLRTRVTFEVGMFQLGGGSVYLAAQEIGFGKRETVPDTARNLSRWVDIIAARVFSHATVVGLALGYTPIDPIRMLIWSAVLNGIVAVPIMTVMMVVVTRLSVMGRFSARPTLTFFGWAGTALMAITVVALLWSSIS